MPTLSVVPTYQGSPLTAASVRIAAQIERQRREQEIQRWRDGLWPKQRAALDSQATEILYGGAAGGGKSHLARASAIHWAKKIADLQVYLFRREFRQLKDNHLAGPTGFRALLAKDRARGSVRINNQDHEILFSNGSRICLRQCRHDDDLEKIQGAEIHYLIVEEATQIPYAHIRYMRSRMRIAGVELPEEAQGLFPRALYCSNPGGRSHTEIKQAFVDPAAPMEIHRAPDEDGGLMRQYIPARLEDNPALDAEAYARQLRGLHSAHLVDAMLNGSWDIDAGGMFGDVWDAETHILEPFDIPESWRLDRSHDWGTSKPSATIWWAEADGTEATLADNSTFCPPRGSLIAVAEYYTWTGEANRGARLSSTAIANEIVATERQSAYLQGHQVFPGPADSAIWTVEDGESIADRMGRCGVSWIKADKSPGSRVPGWQLVREYLEAAKGNDPDSPHFYTFRGCSNLIRTLPTLPRDKRKPDDVDTDAEDHIGDAVRYRVRAPQPVAASITPLLPM